MKNYGITVMDYEKIYKKQNGLCAICGRPEKTTLSGSKTPRLLAVDHSHKTNKVRKLLCSNCNSALGFVNENRFILIKMVEYITYS